MGYENEGYNPQFKITIEDNEAEFMASLSDCEKCLLHCIVDAAIAAGVKVITDLRQRKDGCNELER